MKRLFKRLVRSYGTVSFDIFASAKNIESLGESFGSGLYEKRGRLPGPK